MTGARDKQDAPGTASAGRVRSGTPPGAPSPLRALLAEATPGPWHRFIDADDQHWILVRNAEGRELLSTSGGLISTEEANAALASLAPDMARLLLDMGDALTATAQVGCQPGTRFQDYTRTCGICDTCVARSLVARLSALGDGTADR